MSRAKNNDIKGMAIYRWVAPLLALSLIVASCTSGGDPADETGAVSTDTSIDQDVTSTTTTASGDPSTAERVLRIGLSLAPSSGLGVPDGFPMYSNLAYETLIRVSPDGSAEPRLAESWREVGDDNTEIEITMREGVTFSDGTPLTAEAVQANIEFQMEAGGPPAARLNNISSMEVVDELTLRLTFSEPEPLFAELFSQMLPSGGRMASPAALAEPDRLATETFGAGPYVLAVDETVPDDTYVYVPNPSYWNPEDIHWDSVVIKVLPDDNTRLAAITTDQVDVIDGASGLLKAADTAGLHTIPARGTVTGLILSDREGRLSEPLGDIRVRQALNYAVDRETITQALLGEYGTPTDQLVPPGWVGHNEEQFYSYDPDKARELLAEAGYPDGFAFSVWVISGSESAIRMLEAVGADLELVGVTLEIEPVELAVFLENTFGGPKSDPTTPAVALGWGFQHPHVMGERLWLEGATGINLFDSSDPVVEDLNQQAQVADEATQADLYSQLVGRLVEQAWFLPVSFEPGFLFRSDRVAIDEGPRLEQHSPEFFRPAG